MKKYPYIFTLICKFSLSLISLLFCPMVFSSNTPSTVAEIALCTGKIQLGKQDKTTLNNGTLAAGDTLQTTGNSNSRCRITFANGNALHIGPGSLVRFDGEQQASLLQGQVLAYAMPILGQQQGQPMQLRLGDGVLDLAMGNAFATIDKDKHQLAIFNDLASATWHGKQGQQALLPGSMVNLSSATLDNTPTPANMEMDVSGQMSPETPAVEQATQAFKNRDLATSARLFGQIQHAFPYNKAASYYLGLLELKENKLASAVTQWRKYDTIDPDGAKQSGVTKQLTLINTQAIQEEVKQAVANEQALSNLPPEPYSVAVHPLINRGAEHHLPIGKGLTAFVITDLAKVPGLKVLEREKLQKLIDEIKLSESGELVEKSARVRAGRIMRAEKLMIGDYLIEPSAKEHNKAGQ